MQQFLLDTRRLRRTSKHDIDRLLRDKHHVWLANVVLSMFDVCVYINACGYIVCVFVLSNFIVQSTLYIF